MNCRFARVVLGTIDSGYRGEVGVIADNTSTVEYASKPRYATGIFVGDNDFNITKPTHYEVIKISKGVITPVETAHFVEVDELAESQRGVNGFGSTGVK